MIKEIQLIGNITPAPCACHAGKFFATVHVFHESFGEKRIAAAFFDTEEQADKQIEVMVRESAAQFITELTRLHPYAASKLRVMTTEVFKKWKAEIAPTVH